MKKIAISVPSGSHHRALLQPLRNFLVNKDWKYLIISPGTPWADEIFPASEYPREQFSFVEVKTEKWNDPQTKETLKRYYQEFNPDLVLTTTTGRDSIDRPILTVAKEMKIMTCTFVESWDNIWKMVRKREEQIVPDFLLVWNKIMRDHLLNEFPQVDPEKVFITGSPRLDIAARLQELPSRHEVCAKLGLDPQKRILHFSTVELYKMTHVAKDISDAKKEGTIPQDLQLLATVHPGGKFEVHQEWAKELGFVLKPTFGRHKTGPHPDFVYNPTYHENALLMSLFKEDDIMINFSSTVALEAMLMDTPTIGVMYGKKRDWWNWRKSAVVRDFKEHYADLLSGGGVRVVKNKKQLISAINDYLKHPEKEKEGRIKSCEIIMTTLAGDASKKTFEIIEKILS